MSLVADLKVLYKLALAPVRGASHAERMDHFYQGQAGAYDDFRRRLLHGREQLFQSLEAPAGGIWVDLGGGTGGNLEFIGPRLSDLGKVYVVDLADSLLEVARGRVRSRGWSNVEPVLADATTFAPPEGHADVVTFSYSLTMIPDWVAAVEQAMRMLRPGGLIGVVDFYVSRKHVEPGRARHSWWTRTFWPTWFAADNVFLSPDHLPSLSRQFEIVQCVESAGRVPYVPLGRVPHYVFIGRKRGVGGGE